MKDIKIKAEFDEVEIAWFDDLCNGDYRYLTVPDGELRSSFEHCKDILVKADDLGFDNILLPSSYQTGQDTLTFAAAGSVLTKSISLLTAVRCGELHPPMLARSISTLDHMLRGRLTVNIISSDLPGSKEDSTIRYQKSKEVIQILKQGWTQNEINFQGKHYQFKLDSDPVKPYQEGGPLLYFGGISDAAKELCAEFCDVFLLWPETEDKLQESMLDLSQRATRYGRKIDFGLRIHLIIRDTEKEAKEAAKLLVSKLDSEKAELVKHRALDSNSLGVVRQDELRKNADSEGYIEPFIWSGIGQARSGCGSAIVGTPDQILEKIERYKKMGFRAFIFSGYPLLEEAEIFGKNVLPNIKHNKLAKLYGKYKNETPITPLTTGQRK